MEAAIMSLGDNIAHPLTGIQLTEGERHRQLVEQAVWAAEAGFDAVHIGEHHFNEYILSAPPVVLAAICERAPNLILSTAVTLTPTLDPVRAAEDYATLDLLSGGRVEIVAGRGNFFAKTYPAFGLEIDEARSIFDERTELLQRLLTEEDVTWSGTSRPPLDGVTIRPRPTRPIPMWIGAGSRESIELTARLGCMLMLPLVFGDPKMFIPMVELYRRLWEENGRDPADIRIGACNHTFVGSGQDDVMTRFAPRYEHYWNFVTDLIAFSTGGRVQMEFDLETFLDGPAIAGSAQHCIDRIGQMHEMFDLDRQLFMFDMGGISDDELQENLQRFGAEVLPHLPD